MEYIIAILVGLGIIWAVYYYSNKAEKKKDGVKKSEEKEQEKSEKANDNDSTKEESSSTTATVEEYVQVSLDQLYANSHGIWVCRYCETLNDAGKEDCSACGAKKR